MRAAAASAVIVTALLWAGASTAYAGTKHLPRAAQEEAGQREQGSATPGPAGVAQENAGSEDGAQEHEQEEHGPTWKEYAYKWTNFFMLVAILYWLLVVPPTFVIENFDFPGLRVVLAARARDIVAARALALEQQHDGEECLAGSAARLHKVGDEIEALLADARAAAATERQRVEAAAVEEAVRIREGAARDLDTQMASARRDLRRHVADLAVSIARDLVKGNFSEQDQRRLVREYLHRLESAVA